MLIDEIVVENYKIVMSKKGNQVVRKYRCLSGQKKCKTYASPTTCSTAKNLTKSRRFTNLLSKRGGDFRRKSRITKKTNPASIHLKKINKSSRIKKSRSGRRGRI
jgi:hypothetical protein